MATKVNIDKVFLSRQEVADVLGVSLSSIVRGIQKGDIPFTKIGGRVLIPVSFIDELTKKTLYSEEK